MADKKEKRSEEKEEESKIPVFTVLKKGAILKNIFVINKSPSPPSPLLISKPESVTSLKDKHKTDQEMEEILIVGRHPDCDIMLTHPSISRFHLQIRSKPSSQKLSVIDLSSVHGTWVSEKKIEPGVRVELNEGDTIRVGGSTRVYRLHWISLSRAYDMDNPFVSPMDVSMEKEEEENGVLEAENAVATHQNALSIENKCLEDKDSLVVEEETCQDEEMSTPVENEEIRSLDLIFEDIDSLVVEEETCQDEEMSTLVENEEIRSLDLIFEDIDSLFSDENSELIVKKEIPSAPLMPVSDIMFDVKGDESPSSNDHKAMEISSLGLALEMGVILETQNQQYDKDNQSSPELVIELISERENQESFPRRRNQKSGLLISMGSSVPVEEVAVKETEIQSPFLKTESMNSSFPEGEFLSEIKSNQINKEKQNQEPLFDLQPPSERENKGPLKTESANSTFPEGEFLSEIKTKQLDKENQNQEPPFDLQPPSERENKGPLKTKSVNSTFPEGEFLSEIKTKQLDKENQNQEPPFDLQPLSERENLVNFAADQNLNLLVNRKSAERLGEGKNQRVSRKGHEQREMGRFAAESVNSYLPVREALSDITENKESQTTQSCAVAGVLSDIENLESSPLRSERGSKTRCIWSRRGKPAAAALQVQTSRSKGKTRGAGNRGEVELQEQEGVENTSISKALFSGSEEIEEEIFTPEKENLTPNTLILKSLKKMGKLEETKHSSKAYGSFSKAAFNPNFQSEENWNDNQIQVLKEQKPARCTSRNQVKLDQDASAMKRRTERVPFQSLVGNSPGKSGSDVEVPIAATRSRNSVSCSKTMEKRIIRHSSNHYAGDGKRRWTIIVDTTSLLDKESRKSLQLLQGLKGTQLIIPRMVIRELDCLNRHGSLFRRTTEASAALGWIEECMAKTKYWIHVQSSMEEVKAIAPTPPASPQSLFSEGGGGFSCQTTRSDLFPVHGDLMEIVSPTAEDHILDCALLYRKVKNDGQLVLLSNDVTLKIKAMAEGLICETAQEFRESLVNPFSERFLWADSSPRGLTWSHLDDVVLKEKYSRSKKLSKGEGAKGLKLILLHNSHYGHINSFS